jgi:hypothetical protein
MPLKIGKRIFPSFADAVRSIKRQKPWLKDPAAYVGAIESKIKEHQKAKKESKPKK